MKKSLFYFAAVMMVLAGVQLFSAGQAERDPDPEKQSSWENPAERYADAWKDYADAEYPVTDETVKNFVFFARDREDMRNHPFLYNPRFTGAQVMYSWKQLEPEKDRYDFSLIGEDLEFLEANGKKLFIQLQDATFNPNRRAVPDYLLAEEYSGGAVIQIEDGEQVGWLAKRWDPEVQKRFACLLDALGREYDGRIEGLNLQESAVGMTDEIDEAFSPEVYAEALKTNMLAMRKAFSLSVTMQYANFMPGEWLPWEDRGLLRSVYLYGEETGVGLGGPDLMPRRKGQLNHTIALMHEGDFTVPLGIAVQDGNYIGKTGADRDYDGSTDKGGEDRPNIVPMLYEFAKDFMGVSYIFWSCQEPYFTEDVLTSFPAVNP